ncbi:hypothetical protein ACW50_07745 [Salmonella enterica subsp. enterica]|nr:hypothetical protein [Salmonella enterica subsp. enterica]EDT9094310.1 hypothetical protein [Salmonella enterica subsp. enterica]
MLEMKDINSKDNLNITGDIMRQRIFLPLLLVLSATAFSASSMAASDTKAPPDNSKNASRLPPFPAALIYQSQEWCHKYPPGTYRPPFFCEICQC